MRISIMALLAALSGCATQDIPTHREIPITAIRGHSCASELTMNRLFSLCPPVQVEFQSGRREWLPIYSQGGPGETVLLRCTSGGECLDEALMP